MDNIRVAARVRPFNERERNEKASVRWEVNEKDNTMSEKRACVSSSMATYVFDRVYNMDATNFSIFTEFVQPIVASVVKGFHGTIFAYGQTSSGKTHTMMGSPDNPGIIPLSLKYIFASIHRNPTREFLLRVSYIEIYNEVITDLLQPSKTNLKIKENAQKEVIVECSEKCLSSVKMALELIAEGEKNRHFGETLMNEKSSRSHTVFTIIVESREATGDGDQDYERAVQVAKLNLVDLAGSERVSQTGSEGIRLKEGGFINRSLFHLGNVIHKLSERDGGHVPFRESKLTRLLQTSLGGNAHTRIICNITATAVEETHSTLKFASRAKTIENNPHVNEVLSDGALLQRYRTQITDLQRQLQETGIGELRSENERLALEAQQSSEERVQLTSKIRQLERFVLTCSRETRHQLKSKSKAALRRQTVCPSVLSRNLADDMYLEPVEEDEEQDSWFLPSKISIERDIYSDERRVTGSSTPQLKNVTSFSPVDAVLMSSGSANSSHSVAELEQKITTLQEKLDNKDSELMAMLNKQCAEKEQLHNELDMSKKELARTALQSKALMAKNTELEKKLNSCVEANKAENEELVALRNRVKITEKENAHLTEAKDHLEKQLSPVQKKCDEMEDNLQKSRRLQVQLSAELDHVKKDLELAQTNCQSLKNEQRKLFGVLNENQMLKEELNQYQVNHDGQLTWEESKTLLERVTTLEKENAHLTEAKYSLEKQLSPVQKKCDEMEDDLQKSRRLHVQLSAELDHAKKNLELAQTNYQSLESEQRKLFGVLNENQMLKEELDQYQVNHAGQLTQEESKTLLEQVTTLEKENVHLTEAKCHLEKQLSPVQKKCDEMEDDLQKSRRLQVQLSAELDHVKKDLELAQTNYQSLENEQRKLFDVLNENQMLKEQLDQYQENHARKLTHEESKTLLERVTALEKENAHLLESEGYLQKHLTRVKKDCDQMEDELQSLKEFENLQDQQLDHITKEFEAAKLACHSLESEREQLLGVFNENQKLRQQLESYQANEQAASAEAKALTERVHTLEKENAHLLESEQYSRKHYDRIKKECDQMEDELESLQKLRDQQDEEIKRQLEQAKSDCQNLQEQLGKYQRQNEESKALAEQVTMLEKENARLLESEQYAQKHYTRIKKECDQMEDELEMLQKSRGQQDEEMKRQLEQAKSDYQNLQEQLGKYQRRSEESEALAEQVTKLEKENARLLESEQYSRKHYNRIKKECDQMEDELEALQKSSGQRDEEIERQLEQAKSDCQNLQEQLGKYQRQSEESRAFAKQVTVLEVEGREWKQKYHDLSERLKVEYDARLARSSRELKRLQAENERLRSEGRTQATSSMAGDWVSNASEAAAYSLRLQRDKLKMDLEKETTKLDKSQKKAMWLEHENKKYQKRTHELEEQVISLKRELNSKGRVGYVTEVSSKVAKEDSGREMSELRPLRHLNRDMTADKSEERLECTGQAMMTESSLKPDAENKCATQ